MANLFDIRAGRSALKHIRDHGLQPQHISAIFAASGAAKWLAIYGLDRAIFSQWLPSTAHNLKHPILTYGTSVGAVKLAAACRTDSATALDNLAEAYLTQDYSNGINASEIDREFERIRGVILEDTGSEEILSHPYLRFACATVRCHGWLASCSNYLQIAACGLAAALNLSGNQNLRSLMSRVVLHDSRSPFPIASLDGYTTHTVTLNHNNLAAALTASGSIPVHMFGVTELDGAGAGVYRDGGLLDYHPVPGNFWQSSDQPINQSGLILYPHFYPHCTMRWFDKQLPWRKTPPELMDKVVLIHPSKHFFDQTQLGRPPDRKDFLSFKDNDDKRIQLWREVMNLSLAMGQEFLHSGDQGTLAKITQPL